MIRITLAAALLAAASPAFAQANSDMTPNTIDVVEVSSAIDQLDSFLEAALAAGIAEKLATTRDITVFAPINAAFGAVEGLPALKADRAKLTRVLDYHVVPTAYLAADIPEGETRVRTLAGEMLTITRRGGAVTVKTPSGAEAMVVQADLKADNGVVHAINTVLMP